MGDPDDIQRIYETPLNKRHRDIGALLAAIVFLVAGLLALENKEAGWFGVVEVRDRQALLFGWTSIVFSVVIFFAYLRGGKANGKD